MHFLDFFFSRLRKRKKKHYLLVILSRNVYLALTHFSKMSLYRIHKNQQYLSQIHVFDKISLTKIKTRKSFKKGSEKSQICQGKPTNTWQIKFLMDWSLNLSQIIKPFPPSNLGQIFIWDVFFVRRNAPLRPHQVKYSKTKIPFKSAKGKFTCDFFVLFWLSGE